MNHTPQLVLLPGMDGTGELFQPFIRALGPNLKPIAISYPKTEPLNYLALENLVRCQLPTGKPFVLLAESFSGPIAISLASTPPSNLKGLILCCSFAVNPRPFLRWIIPFIKLLPFRRFPSFLNTSILFGRFSNPELKLSLKNALSGISSNVFQTRLASILAVDVRRLLSQISLPILYLHANEDSLVPRASTQTILDHQPKTCVAKLTGPHLLLQTAPEECAIYVKEFLAKAFA